MANRYWVGGSGTWDNTSTTNWSASSGGASGASAPTATDTVVFDNNSNVGTGSFTVTVGTTALCLDMTFGSGATALDGAMTLAFGATGVLTVSGNWTNPATNFSTTGNGPNAGAIIFNSTTTGKTITTNGVTITANTQFNSATGGWTLGSAYTNTGSVGINFITGTLDTGGYNMTVTSFQGTGTKTFNLNSSTITTTGSSFSWSMSGGLTVNAGTSQINSPPITGIWQGLGQTYYNVTFTGTNTATQSISGANTFNNLTITGRTTIGIAVFTFNANQTINGTLTIGAGTAAAYRTMLASNTIGTQRTLTVNAIASLTDIDFRDIIAAGASGTWSGTRLGDCGGNSNITFPAAKTVYYRQTGSANWGATGSGSWSATSGGAADATMFPLAQDTAVFPASTYPASGSTTTINANYNIGTIDMSLRTSNTMTLATGTTTPVIYGNWTNGTGTTLSGTSTITFAGRTTQQITSAGVAFTQNITINNVTGTVQLQDAFTSSSGNKTILTSGTLNLQSYTLSASGFNGAFTSTRTIAFGTGNITCTGTGVAWDTSIATGLTTTGTQVVNVTSVGSTSITAAPGSLSEANSISFNFTGGTYALTIGSSTSNYRSLNFTGFAGSIVAPTSQVVVYGNLTFSTGMTLWTQSASNVVTFSGTSGTQQITTNGKTLDFGLTFNGAGGTFQLQDALTMGSTRTATLTNGTLDLNGKTMTVGTAFTTATGTKNLTFNGGTLVCPTASTTAFNNASPTGFTTTAGTGTGTISMTAATAKTFVGGGSTFNCTLNQGGAGTLTITGSNTFADITNTVQPASVLFTAGTTTTFTSGFSLSGTAGNLITIGSVTAASHTLSKASGTVSVSYCSISRSTATGGATWSAPTSNGNVDGGNNSGWSFAGGGTIYNVSLSETGTSTDLFSAIPVYASVVINTSSATDIFDVAPSIFGATVANTATATDIFDVAPSIFGAIVANTATATDTITNAGSAYNAPVTNTATATDTITNAGSTYNAPVTNTATATDSPSTRQTFITAVSNTATATDAYSVAATLTAVVYASYSSTLSESTYGLPTGTSFAGSVIWSTTSLSRVQVNANGTGSGSSGGFNAGGNYIATGTGTYGLTRLYSQTLDLSNVSSIAFEYVIGDGTNGGVTPGAALQIVINDGVSNVLLGNAPLSGQSTFGVLSYVLPPSTQVPTGQIRLLTISLPGGPNYGIRNITLTYASGLTASVDVSALQGHSPQIAESATATDSFLVAPSTFNAPVVNVAAASDAITNAGSIYNAPFVDAATATDLFGGAFLWNLIDDSQTVTWGVIPTNTPVTWSVVDDSAPTTWQNIDTLN